MIVNTQRQLDAIFPINVKMRNRIQDMFSGKYVYKTKPQKMDWHE